MFWMARISQTCGEKNYEIFIKKCKWFFRVRPIPLTRGEPWESLRNAGMSRRETRAEVERLLEQCGLSKEFADRYPHQVSGGQCQRAAIARALAIQPKLLICDEATSALDVTVQKEIIDLLNQLRLVQGKHLSILFICHDLSLVQQFCDRMLVMYQGEIVEQGKPDDVIQKPEHAYTRRLIDSVLEFE